MALSYGLEAVELNEVYERIINNQKLLLKTYDVALEKSDFEIESLEKINANLKRINEIQKPPSFWQKLWGYIKFVAWSAGVYLAGALIGI